MKIAGKAVALLALALAVNAGAAVTASVNRDSITLADSLELTLKATDGEDVESVDLSRLEDDFEIGTTSTSSRLNIINGRTERSTEFKLVLLPLREGELSIPSFTIDGQRTPEIRVQVTDAPTDVDASRDVFVEAEVDRNSLYVQSQIIHTFRIYQAVRLDDRNRSKLEIPDAVVEELESTSFQRTVNGRTYQVIEVKHAIFPQKSGELTIPAISFSGRRLLPTRSLFNLQSGELVRQRSSPITVSVKPVPASWPDAPWIPAAELRLEESWSTLPEALEVGDSVTRTLTLTAKGIDASQLPALSQADVEGVKVYPDKPRSENRVTNNGITGIGTSSAALLITEPGEFLLPAVRVPWWDTGSNRLRYAEIPERRIKVSGPATSTGVPPTTESPGPASTSPIGTPTRPAPGTDGVSIWLWTTVAALLGWLGTTCWLLMHQRSPRVRHSEAQQDAREPELFKALLRACDGGDPASARSALQNWAQAFFEEPSPPTLVTIAGRFDDDALARALEELDRRLYAENSTTWEGHPLALALKACRKRGRPDRVKSAALPPLYQGG